MNYSPPLIQEFTPSEQPNASLLALLEEKTTRIAHLESRVSILEELIRALKQKQFGTSSEKCEALQPGLFDEADDTEEVDTPNSADATVIAVATHSRRAPKRVSIPADLPRVEVIHDLSDAEKVCPHDGAVLTRIGCETHEQLDIIPASVQVLHHIRYTYACPCCETYLITATKPAQPIKKSMASPRLLATVATQKYVDGIPLYRQVPLFQRLGITLDRTTLAHWMVACGQLIQPLINLIHETVLTQPYLHMDETVVQVLHEPDKPPQSQSYMWVLRSTTALTPAVLFHYAPNRSGAVAKTLLGDFHGALMVDGYEGYNTVCQHNTLTRLGCFAHARRYFVTAKQAQPAHKTGKADQALAFIQALYRIEQTIKDLPYTEKYHARHLKAKPILDTFNDWLTKSLPQVPPKTAIGKALHYLRSQWPRLIAYLEHGDYPIDNNPAENAIRPFVIGRKNWLFSTSQRGAKASANLYSLIETAKANGLDPLAYLNKVFNELPGASSLEHIEALLPWNCKGGVG